MNLQAVLHMVYPPQCLTCNEMVTSDFGLCGSCWRNTPFITGLVCDKCGTPLPGHEAEAGVLCDDCLTIARPWSRGRAAIIYRDNGRSLVLALKHGDRLDLARPAAGWLMRAAEPILAPNMLVAPVPLYWMRLLRRRYNQAALLSAGFAKKAGYEHCPDLLTRPRQTNSQEGMFFQLSPEYQRFDAGAGCAGLKRVAFDQSPTFTLHPETAISLANAFGVQSEFD